MARELEFSIQQPAEQEQSAIPLELLLRSLRAVQKAVFDAGESLHGEHGPRRAGRRPNVVTESCGLEITDVKSGSLNACLATREPAPQLLEEDGALGDRAVDLVTDTLNALQQEDPIRTLRSVIPSASFRQRILADLGAACPRRGENFVVTLSNGDGVTYRFTSETKDYIEATRYEPMEDVRSIIGELIQLRLVEPRRFRLRRYERELDCAYGMDLTDEVLSNAGEVVAVRGRVYIDENDRISRMDEVFDIEPVDLSPLELDEIELGGRVLQLREMVHLRPEIDEDTVVIEWPALRLIAYGETSDEAIQSLYEDVFFLWDQYAQEEDADLTQDAKDLKDTLVSELSLA